MIVADLMTENTACIRPNQSLSDAARLMWECDCGALPVLNSAGEVCGMITDRDICMATWLRNSPPHAIPVSSVMSRHLHSCAPSDPLSSAEALMREKQIRRVPVLNAVGQLLGILSLADLAKQTTHGTRAGLLADEVASTLADICRATAPAKGFEGSTWCSA